MAGLSGRSIGHGRALLAVFVISSIGLSLYMVIDGQPMTIDLSRQWLIIIFGVLMTVAMLLLYLALALGPLSVAAPIVAAHPVIVVLFAFALGSRPSILQWVGMALATLGAVIVARAISGDSTAEDRLKRRKTVIVASCTSVVYATVIIAGQHAVPIHGELQTLWLGRVISLMTLIVFLGFTRTSPLIPIRWWPFLCLQGTLDAGGILFLLYGSAGDFTEITAVIGSLFGAVTILLARVFLKEQMSAVQWAGIILIFFGVGFLVS